MIFRIFLLSLGFLAALPTYSQTIVTGQDETFYPGPEWTVVPERGVEYMTYRIQMPNKITGDSLMAACKLHFAFFKGNFNQVDQIKGTATYYFNDHCTTVNVTLLLTMYPNGELVINIRPENIRPSATIGPKYWWRYFFDELGHYVCKEPEYKYFMYVNGMEQSAESFAKYVQ